MAGRIAPSILIGALLAIGASGAASGQTAEYRPRGKQDSLQRHVDAERAAVRAEQTRMNAAVERLQRRANPIVYKAYAIPADVDALAGTGAPAYRLDNGVTIRVTGGLSPSSAATCVTDCPQDARRAR